jgi:hypothetical protein
MILLAAAALLYLWFGAICWMTVRASYCLEALCVQHPARLFVLWLPAMLSDRFYVRWVVT